MLKEFEMKFTRKLIAPCGINCGVCLGYLREKNRCHGCREAEQNEPATRYNCVIRNCKKRGEFCSPKECDNFPCARLKRLDKRYRERYDMSELENLKMIREEGIEAFLKDQEKKYLSPEGVYCVHRKCRFPYPKDESN
jgi:hypothetical protein